MSEAGNYLPDVREQYEEFPYPERDPLDEKKRLVGIHASRLDNVNHHCFEGKQTFENFKVLVAGGGTGDSAVLWGENLRNKTGSSVTYLDMSEHSASIAKERAHIRKLDNITWIVDSILNIPDLGLNKFDLVECNGVLHHLEDPDAGLKALRSVLKPNGALNIMVYGKYGRTGIYMVQDLMRLINNEEGSQRQKIKNTKGVLKNLPSHHWYNASQNLGWMYPDAESDAGIFDLFLHTQDRSYTILEVHDWLERCDLQMSSEPGMNYSQTNYLPELFIKDRALLDRIKTHPLKIQQAIGEAVSSRVSRHEFYAVRKGRKETAARITDGTLIPWAGINPLFSLSELAAAARQNSGDFTVSIKKMPANGPILIPNGKFSANILQNIDGNRCVDAIVKEIQADEKYRTPPERGAIMSDFDRLFTGLNRGHLLFLRHRSVQPFDSFETLKNQMNSV